MSTAMVEHRTLPELAQHHAGITVGFMEVTPDLAQTWLALLNTHNRAVNKARVSKYARDMANGDWLDAADPLRFAGNFEQILDCQHRLMAQVEANVTRTWLVAVGVDPDAQRVMDQGGMRSLSDVLHLDGVKNSKGVAAIVRGIHNYAEIGSVIASSTSLQPTNTELRHRFAAHPECVDHYAAGIPGMSAGMFGTLSYLTHLADPEDAAAFIAALRTGAGLEAGNPIHTLRERLARDAAQPTNRLPSERRWVFAVTAWNAWRQGRALTKLQFKPGGARPDRVPTLDGIAPREVA
jgi:hypothetical protein